MKPEKPSPDWTGQTCCIIASGPSLTLCDAQLARSIADRVIVINESWRLCPNADMLYGADEEWWHLRAPQSTQFAGERVSIDLSKTKPLSGVTLLSGIVQDAVNLSGPIATGRNSAFQAMQVAMRRGCRDIIFIGLDMRVSETRAHWHPDHGTGLRNPPQTQLDVFAQCFADAAPVLAEAGINVVNSSRQTALECFPRYPLLTQAKMFNKPTQ